jgi:hypothetical protein
MRGSLIDNKLKICKEVNRTEYKILSGYSPEKTNENLSAQPVSNSDFSLGSFKYETGPLITGPRCYVSYK